MWIDLKYALKIAGEFIRRSLAARLLHLRLIAQGVHIGRGCQVYGARNLHIQRRVIIQRLTSLACVGEGTITIGAFSRIGEMGVLSSRVSIEIGTKVLIAARCLIITSNHEFANPHSPIMDQGGTIPKSVKIGDGSWLGINCCIMPGVTLGKNCVVGANSVVTKSFPDGSVVAGVPAKLIRSIADHPATF